MVEDQGGHELVRFYIPEAARWRTIQTITTGLGEHLTDAQQRWHANWRGQRAIAPSLDETLAVIGACGANGIEP